MKGYESSQNPAESGVTFRSLLIASVLIVGNSYWLMANWGVSGYGSGQSFPTVATLYFNVILCLTVLIGGNLFIRQIKPKLPLKETELLVIYIMLSLGSSLAGHDTLQILWPMVTYSIWFARPENEWALFHRYLPDWLTIKDKSKLTAFYQGESTFYTWEHFSLWLPSILWWSALIIVLTLMMLFIVVLVRERWIRHEKLAYPVIQLPLSMTERGGLPFLKNKLMWLGFALAGGANLLNGLHFLDTRIPGLGGSLYNLGRFFDTKPLSDIGYMPVAVYPFAIGLSFFIPLDLSFSIWFFYLFGKMTRVLGSILGLTHLVGFPYLVEQSFGAWFCLALVALWMSRKFLLGQLKLIFHKRGKKESDEPLSVRGAVLGLAIGGIFLIIFCQSAGAPLWAIVAYFSLLFAIAFAITRVRAEVGPPSHDIPSRPTTALVNFLGARRLGAESLTLFSLFHSFNRSYRCHPMPNLLEGFFISAQRRISNRQLFGAMALAAVVGTLSSAWAYYSQAYNFGAALYGEQAQCRWTFDQLTVWITNLQSPNVPLIIATLTGLGFTLVLMAFRHRFLWWPFHPAGYALSLSYWNTSWYWFSIFISWFLKLTILKFGGLQTHRRSVPFFMGLVFGDFLVGGIWSLLGVVLQQPMYRFLF